MTKNDSAQTPRVALLIDADNVSEKHAEFVFKRAAAYGNIIVRKAYSVAGCDKWKKETLFKYAIEPVMRPTFVSGKNATDIVLVIDAMDLAYRKIADVFCIASNDSDFTPLAMKLREFGVQVFGFGGLQASKSFAASCDEFHPLSAEESAEDSEQSAKAPAKKFVKTPKPPAETPPKLSAKIKSDFSDAYDNCGGEESGWVNLGTVGSYLRRIDPAFSPKNHGFSNLTKLAESIGEFDIELVAGTSPRVKRKGKAAR